MVFEYAEQGDMHRYLEAQRATGKYLSERQALGLFRQVAAGTHHLHAHGDAPPPPQPPLTTQGPAP
jgi:serine/threonine protein kinase